MPLTDIQQAEVLQSYSSALSLSAFFSAVDKFGIYRCRFDFVDSKALFYTAQELVMTLGLPKYPLAGTKTFDLKQIGQAIACGHTGNITTGRQCEWFVQAGAVSQEVFRNGNEGHGVWMGCWGEHYKASMAPIAEENDQYIPTRETPQYQNGQTWQGHEEEEQEEGDQEEESPEEYLKRREREINTEFEAKFKEKTKDMKRKLEKEAREKERKRRY